MLEIFQYSFMVRAFIAGIVTAVIAPLVGTFLVTRRYSLVADSFAHIALAGIAIGLIAHLNPVATALVVTLLAAVYIEKLRTDQRISGDTALAIFLSSGLAIAVVLMSVAKGFNADLLSYLFGSITTVTAADLWLIIPLGFIIAGFVFSLYKELLFISFDEEAARVSRVPTGALNLLLILATAVMVVVSMRIVGVLLIGSLVVIPVATAMQLARSFKQTLWLSIAVSIGSVVAGIFISYYWNLATGGTIVLLNLLMFTAVVLMTRKRV